MYYYIDEKEEPWYHRDDAHSKTVATSTSKESVTSLDDLQLHFIVPSLSLSLSLSIYLSISSLAE